VSAGSQSCTFAVIYTLSAVAFCVVALLPGVAWAQAGETTAATAPTFTKHIAPLVFTHCGACHRPTGSAPFSLLTYSDARPRAAAMARVTVSRAMPPWKTDPTSHEFIGQRRLTAQEITTFAEWARTGAREGTPSDLPPLPIWNDGWQLGTPDLVLTPIERYTLPATGPDRFRVFVLSIPLTETRYVRGVEFRPDDPRVTHHANILIDRSSTSRERNAEDPTLGESGLLAATTEYPNGHLLGWTPGLPDPLLPQGLSWPLDPGTDVVVQLHMVPDGQPRPVRFSIGLFFAPDPPQQTPAILRLGRRDLDIPAGAREYVTTDSYVVPVDVDVRALKPHAHFRARSIEALATLPDGTTRSLLTITDWDFRWQHVYRYVEPISLPKGTRVAMRYVYENSPESKRNPERPPRRVVWGPRSNDEMGDLWIQVLTRTEADRLVLTKDFGRRWMEAELMGFETLLARDRDNPVLHEEAGLLNLQLGRAAQASSHYQAALQRRPGSAMAYFNVGTALLAGGRLGEAERAYREAIRLRPGYAAAHNNLGNVLMGLGRASEALTHYEAAIAADPRHAGAHNNRGQLLMSRGELTAARASLETATALNPRLPDAHYNLGLLLQALDERSAAAERLQRAVSLAPEWDRALTSLAWLLATSADDAVRNVPRALELAERATRLTARRSAPALDALAAAYAASGQFERAVGTVSEALRLASGTAAEPDLRERRALYEARHPFRE